MTVLRDVLARFGIQVDAGPLERLEGGIGDVMGGLTQMANTLAAGTAVNQLRAFVNETASAVDDLGDMAERLNISATALQAWQHAARLNGVDDLNGSLSILQRNLAGAATGDSHAAQAFRHLGVDIRGADGEVRRLDEVLPEIAEGMTHIRNPALQAAAASGLFGRSGAQLVPLLSRGAEGVAALTAEFEALGGGAGEEVVQNASDYEDQMARLDVAMFSLRTRIANQLLPTFIALATATTDNVATFTEMADRSNVLEAAIYVLAGAAVAAGLAMSAAWAGPLFVTAAVAIGIGFLILLVDDLITMFRGGTSVIGGFIDEVFGVGTAADIVGYLTEAWHGLTMAVGDATAAVAEFFGFGAEAAGPTGEVATTERGMTAGGGISAEEDAVRDLFRRASEGEVIDPEERTRVTTAFREAEARRAGVPEGGTAAVPAAGGGSSAVSISSPVTVTLPVGSDRAGAERVRAVVEEALDERNRAAVAALTGEAVEEEA